MILGLALAICGASAFVLALQTQNSGNTFYDEDRTVRTVSLVLLALGLFAASCIVFYRHAITWPVLVVLPLLIAQSMYFLAYLSIFEGLERFAAGCSGFAAIIAIFLIVRWAKVHTHVDSGSVSALLILGVIGSLSGAYFFLADGWKISLLGSDIPTYSLTLGSRWISGGSGIDWWISSGALIGALVIPFLAGSTDDARFAWSLALGSLMQIAITYALPSWYWIAGEIAATPAILGLAVSASTAIALLVIRTIQLRNQAIDPIDVLSGRP